MIRAEAQLTVSRFCELIGLSRRAFYARRRNHLSGRSRKGPWPSPALDEIEHRVVEIARREPEWGHRRVWAELAEQDAPAVSISTVRRAMSRRGLLRSEGSVRAKD